MREIPSDVLRLAFEAVSAGAWLADHEIGSVTFSDRACEIFGLDPADGVSRDVLLARIHPDDIEAFDHAARLSVEVAGDGRLDRTYRIVRPDGTVCWVRDLARTWFDGTRTRATISAGIIIDVTERATEIEARIGRERGFRRLADNSPDIIERFDLDCRLLFANRAGECALGRSTEADGGKTLTELGVAPEAADRLEGWIRQVIASRQPGSFQDSTRWVSGDVRHHLVRIVPELSDDGDLESVLVISTDVTEQQRLVMALARSEERYHLATDAIRGLIYDIDLVADRITSTSGTAEVLGLDPTEAPADGAWWRERVHPDDRAAIVAGYDAAIATRSRYQTARYRIRHQDGRYVHFLDRYTIVRDEQGRPVRRIGCAVDVTDETVTKESVRLSEERLRLAAEAARVGTYDYNPISGELHLSLELRRMLGFDADRRVTFGVLRSIVYPADRDRAAEIATQVLAPGGPDEYEHEWRAIRDGQVHWYRDKGRVTRADGNGAAIRLVGAVVDMTEKRGAEERLAERQRFVEQMMNVAPLGIYVVDVQHGTLVFSNRVLREVMGPEFRPGQLLEIGTLADRLHADDLARVVEYAELVKVSPDDVLPDVEFRLRQSDGSWRWYRDATAILERTPSGQPRRLIGARLDITEIKSLETELRSTLGQLKQADRQKDEFLATLAHELRNPLAPIKNAIAILRLRGPADPTVERTRDLIDRQVGHLVRLVDDLLDLSRISRGKIELKRAPVDLREVVETAVETSQPLIDAARHELTVSLPATPVVVDGDATRLVQIVANLLNNAANYTGRGGKIQIALERVDPVGVIRIRDDGEGIAPEMLSRIFDMFTQVERAPEQSATGLGIGLTLAERLVRLHGGTVDARSDGPGRGSEFSVRLPLAPPAPPAETTGDDPAVGRATQRRRILVADDNRDACHSLAMLLEIGGHEVTTAHDGADAIALARRSRPDVILLDLGMPRMDGYEVAALLRRESWAQDTRLIAVTGWGQESDRLRTKEAGFDFHLTKPVDLVALESLLRTSD